MESKLPSIDLILLAMLPNGENGLFSHVAFITLNL